jgi:hypothetical protein
MLPNVRHVHPFARHDNDRRTAVKSCETPAVCHVQQGESETSRCHVINSLPMLEFIRAEYLTYEPTSDSAIPTSRYTFSNVSYIRCSKLPRMRNLEEKDTYR